MIVHTDDGVVVAQTLAHPILITHIHTLSRSISVAPPLRLSAWGACATVCRRLRNGPRARVREPGLISYIFSPSSYFAFSNEIPTLILAPCSRARASPGRPSQCVRRRTKIHLRRKNKLPLFINISQLTCGYFFSSSFCGHRARAGVRACVRARPEQPPPHESISHRRARAANRIANALRCAGRRRSKQASETNE